CVGNDYQDRDFRTFCPKAISGLVVAKLPEATRSRCILLTLQMKKPDQKVEKLTRHFDGTEFRRKCIRWANDNSGKLSQASPTMPDGWSARQEDIGTPLLAIAEACGGDWPQTARECLCHFFHVAESEEAGDDIELLKDIRSMFSENGMDRLSTKEICDRLN